MVTVHFLRSDGREVDKAGPFPWVRAADGSLRAGPDGEDIARFQGGIWASARYDVPKCIVRASACIARFEGLAPTTRLRTAPSTE
jgi:hypothetical protein